jgi:uncharacterized repeat protein (TIGR01451 family)/fimbrial isopeptide formation D2 family protein/LPXTG-motif cell wall-anchored protein
LQSKKLLTRRRLLELRKLVIVTMVFLLSLSNFLPYSAQYAQANETPSLSDLELTQDVDGEERKEVEKGTTFTFNVNALIPESGSSEGTLTILNQVNKQLAIENVEVVVNEEESDLEAVVEGQDVSLDLTPEQLDTVAGQHVTLKITAAFEDEAEAGTEIEHVAEAFINSELAEKAEPVTVALLADAEATSEEEEAPAEEEVQPEEETAGEESSEEEQVSEEEEGTEEEAEASDTGFDFNTTDTYISVTSYNGKPGTWLLQIDGNNPSAGVKAEIQLPSVGSLDSIAMSKDGTEIYGAEAHNNTFFYKITEDGNATKQNIIMPSEIATLKPHGGGAIDPITGHYGLFVKDDAKNESRIILIDPNTGNVTDSSISPNNRVDLRDIIFDDKGNIYYIDATNEEWVRYDRATGEETVFGRVGNIPLETPGFGAGLSYLPSNELLIVFTRGDVFASNPSDNVAKHLVTIPNMNFLTDAASAVFPNFYTELNVEKFANESKETSTVNQNDVIDYKIVVSNTGNLPADNVVLTDLIPEGSEYVPNSTKLNGDAVNDVDGQSPLEKGLKIKSAAENASDGVVLVGEENAATITFQVKVKEDAAAGSDIVNQAIVASSESDEMKSNEVISTVEGPVDPPDIDACANPVALVNGSFEEPPARMPGDTGSPGSEHAWQYFLEDEVPGWKTTASDKFIQIMKSEYLYNGREVNPPHGNQYAELNAEQVSALYQDVETTPGQTIYWRLAHRGGLGVDTMTVQIGSADIPAEELPVIEEISTGDSEWVYYSGTYTVPADQTTTRFAFNSVDAAGGDQRWGNLLDDIFLGTEPCVVAEKSVSPEGEVFEGDELTYEVTVKNNGGDIAADTVIEDAIPEGTEYVPGSMKILNGPKKGDLTDENDDDGGHFDGDKVIINVGDVPNTTELEDGITVQFKVKALSSHVGETVVNKATVGYKNLLTNEDGTTETNEVSNDIIEREDIDACANPVALVNGDFEDLEGAEPYNDPRARGSVYYADTISGWKTTDYSQTPRGIIQIFDPKVFVYPHDPNPENLTSKFAELNAYENSMLYQELPTVPGQTIYWRLDHRGLTGVDSMSVNIGPTTADPFNTTPEIKRISTGTTWKTYSGLYTVPAGQTTTLFGFKAISSANGDIMQGNFLDNVFLGTEPCVVAEKSVSPEGEVFEGDQLTYEVTVKNNGGDVAADTVIEDAIPEGTEYVPGSMKILNGPKKGDLTDESDDDAGQFDGDKVIINIGDLPNTTELEDGITVQFKVKTLSSHVGETVVNKATVGYKNLLTDEDGTTETNEVSNPIIEREDIDACANPVALANGSFEQGPREGSYNNVPIYFLEEEVPGWRTTDNSQGPYLIEIWNYALNYPAGGVRNFPPPPDGDRYAELNAFDNGLLYQDVETTPGQTIKWRLSHMGRGGVDTMQVRIGPATDNPYDTVVQTQMSTGNTAWETYTGTYTVPAGQTVTRFGFEAVSTASGSIGAGNFLDNIFLGTEPCVVAEKSVAPEGEVSVGDELTYEVTVKNTGGDVAADAVFEDAIPEGTEYVPGSMKILTGPNAGDLTDADDNDAGHFDGDKVIIHLGDLPNTTELPDGITVQFKVKTISDNGGEPVVNKATVGYKNLLTDEDGSTETNEVETPVQYNAPKTESEKSAELLAKADGNTDADNPEVGDTLKYTIQTRNTIEDSLITNLTIRDVIPEGLEYVPGTLKVNGEAVSDEDDADEGHVVDGEVFASFGDVKDTEWRTVEFQVVVSEGQAGKDIENVAVVDGDNLEEPDEPREEVKIYPREPKTESKKSAKNADENKERYEVGDTVVYTIQSRNTVSDSLLENLKITDVLPEGLTFVEGSLEVSHGGTGLYEDGKITAEFGEVTDTEWRTVTFEATIDSGYVGETIENIALVEVPNIDEPDEPGTDIDVDPKEPKTESEKSAELLEKADGNTDADNPEVGDTLKYTIQTRNTIEDSLITNLTIRDVIPEGLEYVPGTLKVNGEAVTDEDDADEGYVVDGEVFGSFGDVTDTEWHTLEFQVIVSEGQAGKDIENVAVVDGDNLEEPDEPREEVKIYPREPKTESKKSATNADESKEHYEVGDTVVYTIESRNTVSDSLLENLKITDVLPEGLTFVEGSLEVSHGGTGLYEDGKITAEFGEVKDTEWRTVTFEATIDAGYVGETIENIALVEVPNIDEPDEPGTDIDVDPKKPKTESEKSAELLEKADGNTDADNPEVGDTLKYTIQTRNTIEDSLIANLTIRDAIPAGLEYVPGTLKVNGEAVSDEDDNDQGYVVDGEVFASFGDVKDTDWHTVEFHVVVSKGQAGKDIENVAIVDGDNLEEPDEPREEVKIYPREPKTESKKSATNADESKEHYEVGDTVVYTIQSRNTVSDSLLENLKITDVLPEGLTFVEGSLEVSHGGTGNFEDGKITAEFGEVTDTEWRTVTFEATIDSGYVGETIENIALVEVPNIDEPDEPGTDIDVDPKEPKTESKKSATNADESKEHYEVGDTVVYTIQSRNTVEDSLLENLKITDVLPEGLTFVEGSLEVSHGGTGSYKDGKVTAEFGEVKDTEWRTVTFEATIDSGYVGETIENIALVEVPNIDEPDEPGTDIDVDPKEPKTESKKSATNADENKEHYEVGDTVVYTIQSRNTVEDSLLENLKITDVLPEGLTFVEGSLEVSHGGTGSYKDGKITAEFGEVKDTEWRTVTFEATIDAGHVGETIENIALVEVPNIDEPDEPGTDIDVDPKKPKTESKKSAKNADGSKEHYEVGDTVVYTIEARNTVEDSLLENLKITDVLPEGLTFVEGSLEVSHGGTGSYKDGTVTAEFGEVTDTEWRTVTFKATIDAGYVGETIENIALVEVPNIDEPDEPGTDVDVDPKKPKTESEKSAALLEKADGNTDEDNPEVGDTLRYTIQTRNTIEDSLIKNLTISDVIPEGLEYVPGTLKVNGEAVTDEEDDDQGHYVDGKVVGHFGDVKDTEWRTLEFDVVVLPGQAGKDIENVAVVDGDNFEEPDKPREEVKVYPRGPELEYEKTAKNADEAKDRYEAGDTVVYTIRARNTVSDSLVDNMKFTDKLPEGLTFVEGSLEASHGGTGNYEDGTVTAEFGEVKDTEWRTITFEATINAGYAGETIKNVAVVEVPNIDKPGEPGTEIVVDPKKPKLESKKSAKNADDSKDGYEVGDTVVYTIETRNTIEDSLVEDLRIADQLPEGLAFVEGSLKVSEGGEGSYEDGTVTAEFGNVKDTEWRTVTFEATIEPGFANKTVKNVATVDGGNIDDPDKPEHEVDVDPKKPKLESKKSAKNADDSKDGYEVGDTVVYTIEARNTVEDSLVEDLRITDQLPEGLAFVEGSLQVSDGGTATFEDGIVTAEFGTVTDTEWRTVTFEATIESGTSIKNVATVGGGNIDDPDKPEAEIEINEPPTSPTPNDGDDKEEPVDPTPGNGGNETPQEPKPGNDGTDKPQVPPGKGGSDHPQDKGDGTPGDKSPSDGSKLPKTATSTYNLLLIGASLLVLGAILWFVRRKKAA